jgi:hypothetical protein
MNWLMERSLLIFFNTLANLPRVHSIQQIRKIIKLTEDNLGIISIQWHFFCVFVMPIMLARS